MAQMDKNNAFIYPTGFCEPIAPISVFLNTLTITAHTSSTT